MDEAAASDNVKRYNRSDDADGPAARFRSSLVRRSLRQVPSKRGGGTMFSRMAIAVMAYVLSSVGMLLMGQLIGEELRQPGGPGVFIFVWLIAWVTHAVMTVAWVRDRRLPRVWPVVGTLTGVGSFLAWPFLAAENAALFGTDVAAASAGMLILIQAVLVASCILLAVWLVRFHVKMTKPIPPALR